MMKRLFLLHVLVLGGILSAASQETIKFSFGRQERVPAASITWRGHFGGRKEEPHNTYILMTQGGFRAPTSKNLQDLIKGWMAKYPKAVAVVVYSMEGSSAIPDSRIKAVWVIEGTENLNLYLVRNGAAPAGTMILNPGDETPLLREEYQAFESKFWAAQKLAKKEKLGIWADPQSKK